MLYNKVIIRMEDENEDLKKRIILRIDLRANQSTLTGESQPVQIHKNTLNVKIKSEHKTLRIKSKLDLQSFF